MPFARRVAVIAGACQRLGDRLHAEVDAAEGGSRVVRRVDVDGQPPGHQARARGRAILVHVCSKAMQRRGQGAGAKAKDWGEGYPQCLFRMTPSVARACSVGVGAFGLL